LTFHFVAHGIPEGSYESVEEGFNDTLTRVWLFVKVKRDHARWVRVSVQVKKGTQNKAKAFFFAAILAVPED